MMDKNNKEINALSDNVILEMMCLYIKNNRLEQNITQSQLAINAGINRSTLVELEKGSRVNIITYIQLLRALNLLDVIKHFEFEQHISPIKLAELEQAKRKRASKVPIVVKKNKSNW